MENCERHLLIWNGNKFIRIEDCEVIVSSKSEPDGYEPADAYTLDRIDLDDLIGEQRLEAFKNRCT